MLIRVMLIGFILGLDAPVSCADTWPQFRGPFASGIGNADLPTEWDVETQNNVRFKVALPGLAHSSPVVWNERLFITTAVPAVEDEKATRLETGWIGGSGEEEEEEVEWIWQTLCLSAWDGHEIWTREAHRGVPKTKRHIKATHANCSPATNGRYVVAFFGSEGLYCYDMRGNLVWQKDLGKLHVGPYDAPKLEWGAASSPVIYDEFVIVQCDALNAKFVAILDVDTGEEIRRIPREDVATWSTPAVFDVEGRAHIVCNGYKQMAAYDLLTGEPRWTLEGGGDVPVPTPLLAHHIVYLTNGHGRSPVYAVDPRATGDLTPSDDQQPDGLVWWKEKGGCYMPTPIVFGKHIYLCNDRGTILAANALTGDEVYRQRVGSGKNSFSASVVGAEDRLYWVDEGGEVYVIRVGDEYELLATNSVGESCLATPAIANDALYMRTISHLVCLAKTR